MSEGPWKWVVSQLPYGKVLITKNIQQVYKKYNVRTYMDIRYLKIKSKMTYLAEQGYEQWEIGYLLGARAGAGRNIHSQRSTISKRLRTWFSEIFGDNIEFKMWQDDLIVRRIKSLIIYHGYVTPAELAINFEGLDSNDIFNYLRNHCKEYLYDLLISLYNKGYTSAQQITVHLQLSHNSRIYAFLNDYKDGFSGLKVEADAYRDTVFAFEVLRAARLIVNSLDEEDLLKKIGYKDVDKLSSQEINQIVRRIFSGRSYNEAKLFYSYPSHFPIFFRSYFK